MSDIRPRALVTLPDVAHPQDTGRRLRSAVLLKGLAAHFSVDVVFITTIADRCAPVTDDLGVTRWTWIHPPERGLVSAVWHECKERQPRTIAVTDWKHVRSQLKSWAHTYYDFAWFGAMGHGVELVDAVSARFKAVDYDDIESIKWEMYLTQSAWTPRAVLERAQRLVELPWWRRIEAETADRMDATIVSSPDDLRGRGSQHIRRLHVVPNSYPLTAPLPPRDIDPDLLVLVANFAHPPNRAAAVTLGTEILPALRRRAPKSRVRLVGRNPEHVQHLGAFQGVEITGQVDDIRQHVTDALATVMPISFGGGTRLKALEAFALGIPVISTSFGVSGLGATPGSTYVQAETVGEVVDAVMRLREDPDFWSELSETSRAHYEAQFTEAATLSALRQLVEGLPNGVAARG